MTEEWTPYNAFYRNTETGQAYDLSRQPLPASSRYGRPGYQWAPNAAMTYMGEHRINPTTGALEGPLGLPPHEVALLYQAEHDRAVWNARNRMSKDALGYMQGATNLLQSYRPGGAATLESGIYQNMAQIQLQRASMMQPMDLLSDYRRHQAAKASSAGRKERTTGAIIQGIGAIASLIPGGQVAGAALMAAGSAYSASAPTGIGNAMQANAYSPNTQQATMARPGGPNSQGTGAVPGGGEAYQGSSSGTALRASLTGPGQPLPGGQPAPQPGGAPPNYGPQQGGPTSPAQGGAGGGTSPSQLGPDNPMAGGGGMGGMGGAMQAAMLPGADGDFTPVSYGRAAAQRQPAPDMMGVAMTEFAVETVESDPFFDSWPMAIDAELDMRSMAIRRSIDDAYYTAGRRTTTRFPGYYQAKHRGNIGDPNWYRQLDMRQRQYQEDWR